jgi:fibronectin-binding autotransporter adhesin
MARRTIKYFAECLVLVAFLLALPVLAPDVNGAGDGYLLKRSPEETCHACHKTDRNAPNDPNSIKTHNSAVIGSTKWPSGWGVAGGKYGEFLCTTCHTPHGTTNIYLIRETIDTPDNSNWETSGTQSVTVDFRKKSASDAPDPGSFVGVMGSGAAASTNVCMVCHSLTSHFRWNGSGGDQLHSNVGGEAGADCTVCHSHKNGFAHGLGGTGCWQCHGHDAGYVFTYDGVTYTGQGRGTFQAHSTHTENDSDDLKGPNVNCDTCHDTSDFPYFKSGTDRNGDGKYDLSETDVCDPCHSPGGDYDGVNDPVIGAKANWHSGVYVSTNNSTLQTGKEKWCAGCHDDGNSGNGGGSTIGGAAAPNVTGDEQGAYTYGTGWGFYKTGHGLPNSSTYPASGGVTPGAGRNCDACHDFSTKHLFGVARAYDDGNSSTTDPSVYRIGYRLKLVPMGQGTGTSTQEPMLVPWPVNTANSVNNYRLCLTCHDSGPFTDASNMNTNMKTAGINRHQYHLVVNNLQFPADWSGSNTSQINCVVCHNVHGSTRLAMVRDGKLTGREPGLEIWYKNDAITTNIGYPYPPTPADLPLSASDGTAWIPLSATNLCVGCHGDPNLEGKDRTPFQEVEQAPMLSWTDETGYLSDGADPDSAASGSDFTFRVEYTDTNNDAPSYINLLIDTDNDGTVDATYAMPAAGSDNGDVNYTNGKIYSRTITLTNTGSSVIRYKFEASDGTLVATGPPTNWSTVSLIGQLNHPPELAWVAWGATCGYQGVSPAAAVSGAAFEFRVTYTDADNNAPSSIQVWVDSNDDGTYEPGEKYTMDRAAGGDGDYTNGETYTKTITLSYAGDGMFNYRFVASDGTDAATGDPVNVQSVTVIDSGLSLKTVCSSGCDYTTIQAALDNTPQNGTVLVYPGTYANIQLTNSGSGNQIDQGKKVRSVCGPVVTVISGGTQAVYVSNITDVTVDGFGLTGATWGVYLNTAGATVNNCKIHDNVNSNLFPSNGGAGVYTTNAASTLTLSNSEVYSNTADNGAGLFLNGGNNPVISNSVIRQNTARASGGGVFLQAGVVATFTDTTIKNNTANNYAGGVYFNGASADFYGCYLTGNIAASNKGGFAYMTNAAATADFENCIIADNQATQGGALYANNVGTVNVINSTIADNQATGGNGGAFYNLSTDMTFRNSILWGNTASGTGHNAYFNSGSMTITDSQIASGNDGIFTNAPYFEAVYGVAYTLDISGYMSDNAPMFVDAATGNYHIQGISDAVDHANAAYAPSDDIDGDSRPQGAGDDIGADEYLTPAGQPILSWTGETGYESDGADPDTVDDGSSATFRVDYTSAAGHAPAIIQVWVDKDDNGAYSGDEKFDLTGTDSGDTDYTDGKRYSATLSLNAVPSGEVKYRFYATDGSDEATGDPVSGGSVTVLPPAPAAPAMGVPDALSATSIRWNFTDNATDEEGFKLLDPGETVKVVSAIPNLTYLDEGGLSPNTQYTRHVVAYNVTGDSAGSAAASKYTLSATPNVTADKTASTWYNTTDVVFTNAAGFGSGGVQYYRYIWDQNPGHTFNDTETQWTSGTLTGMATSDGSWYLHVKAYNAEDVASGTQDYGPYYYDSAPPSAADLNPANGAINVDPSTTLTFTLADSGSGVDWSTFEITLSGNKGYSKTYSSGGAQVKKTGTPASYSVTVTPDTDFGSDETITVTVNVEDKAGNALTPPTWSFTTRTVTFIDVACGQSIQAAIDAASTGDIVRVASNCTYSENIDFKGKAITVRSVNGAATTKIQGNNSNNPVVTFGTGETASSVLDGFTIDNQYATASSLDRGMYIYGSAAPTIKNCAIHGNKLSAGANGAGIYINGGSATIVNTTLGGDAANQNTCQFGCGLYATALSASLSISNSTVSYNSGTIGGGIYLSSTAQTTTIANTTFSNNSVSQNGAAIYSVNSPLVITGGSINNNTSTLDGAGLYLSGSSTTASISGASITANTGRTGGGIYATGAGAMTISDSFIDSNATTATGSAGGTGMYLTNMSGATTLSNTSISNNAGPANGAGINFNSNVVSSLSLTGCNINNNTLTNTTSYDGGGFYLAGASISVDITGGTINGNSTRNGGGIFAASGSLSITGATISGNLATAAGGGLYYTGGSTLDISKSVVSGNTASTGGGGLRLVSATATITDCMITGNVNDGTNADGAGISNGGTAYIYNSTMTGNYTTRYGGGLYGAGTVSNSIIWGNTSGGSLTYYNIYGAPSVTYSDIGPSQATYEGSNGNINQPPQFVDLQQASSGNPTTAGNFHIQSGSPCVNSGNNADAPGGTDIDGDARIINGTVDMGADETLGSNATTIGSATASVAGDTSISVSMSYYDDANGSSTYTVDYKLHSDSAWTNWVTGSVHVASPYTTTITGLIAGATYDVRMTYNDTDGVNGTNPQTVTNITLTHDSTTVGSATATAANATSISVSMPYTGDNNASNTYTVKYKLHSSGTWFDWGTNPKAHTTSPYTDAITGLTPGASYDVQMTYNDADGVNGTNPQTVTGITLPYNSTTVGTATATAAGDYSIAVSMPYTDDYNGNNTYTVQYKLHSSGTWLDWGTNPKAHTTSPYTDAITGLTPGETYDVQLTYNDADGVNGTNPQTIASITLPYNSTTAGSATATAAGDYSIAVSMPYTGDNNANSTYTVKYKLSSSGIWLDWGTNPKAHTTSPYTDTITGLTPGATYDVQMTYNDADGVNGTAQQTVTGITLTYNSTTVGTAAATAASSTSIAVSMPYTGDNNASNTYTVDYKLDADSTWTNWVTAASHVASPYATTITGLTPGATYDVRMTYNDADGVNGTNPQTATVTLSGGGISVCSTNPAPFNKIQTTIADSGTTNGATLLVCAGTYPELINFLGKNITVKAESGASVTFITGDNTNNPVVTFSNGETSSAVLDGFTIDNQASNNATRGIYMSGAGPTIKNCIIEGNVAPNATNGGGGVYIDNSSATFDNCTIRANSSANRNGGGMYITGSAGGATITNSTIGSSGTPNSANNGGGIYFTGSATGTLSISGSTIAYNTVTQTGAGIYITGVTNTTTFTNTSVSNNTSSQKAGGIYSESPLSYTGCNIDDNATGSISSYSGGGIYLSGASASATISGGTINGNSGQYGGGIYITGSTAAVPLSISGATMSSNTSNGGGAIYITGVTHTVAITDTTISGNSGGSYGGGIYSNSPLSISGGSITGNTATGNNGSTGGGIYLAAGANTTIGNGTVISGNNAKASGGGICDAGASLDLADCSIDSNTAQLSGGGGLYLTGAGSVATVSRCYLRGNHAYTYGGAAWVYSSASATFTNCMVTGNNVTVNYSSGGGINNGATAVMDSCTISGNYSSSNGGGYSGGGTISNSILWGNNASSGPQINGSPAVTYSDIGQTGYAGSNGNINLDPQFIDYQQATSGSPTTAGDFHIQSGSPCKDAIAPASYSGPGDDIDGDSRPQNTNYDMGADEYVP